MPSIFCDQLDTFEGAEQKRERQQFRVIEELRDRVAHPEGARQKRRSCCHSTFAKWTSVCQMVAWLMVPCMRLRVGEPARWMEQRLHCLPFGIAARSKGKVLWCLTRPDLFFPANAQAGLHPDRVIFCEGDKEEDVLILIVAPHARSFSR
jgi:protein ImuA